PHRLNGGRLPRGGVAPAPGTGGGQGPPPPVRTAADLPANARFITDFAISTVKKGVVWSGSSTGQIFRTADGGVTWTNVTNFPDIPASGAIGQIVTVEAGHNDVETAYVLANAGGGRGGGGGGGAAGRAPHPA